MVDILITFNFTRGPHVFFACFLVGDARRKSFAGTGSGGQAIVSSWKAQDTMQYLERL